MSSLLLEQSNLEKEREELLELMQREVTAETLSIIRTIANFNQDQGRTFSVNVSYTGAQNADAK